jgi:hypothetical protein
MVMKHVLREFSGPLVWGASDCCTSACNVFAALWGVDPMQPLRGRYSSRAGAFRLIRAWGGWDAMTQRLALDAGLRRGPATPGALGLLGTGRDRTLAICTAPGIWAGRIDGGFRQIRAEVAAWGV